MSAAVELSVVVPVFRNRETLAELYHRLCNVLASTVASWELVLVNDGCPHGSGAVIRSLAAADGRVVAVENEQNLGQVRAIHRGLQVSRGEVVAVMDADLQDPPEVLPLLWRCLQQSDGQVWAVFASREGSYEGFGRMVSSRVFKRLLYLLTGLPPRAGGFCVLHRLAVERILACSVPEPHVGILVACLGIPFAEVPFVRPRRASGRSAYSFSRRWRLAWRLLATAWRLRRACAKVRPVGESFSLSCPCKNWSMRDPAFLRERHRDP
ncbi:MAG: glycosyltransferase family 2 protein [Thermoanaerobaculum sp.]|nr:glycosyltransferase family 2 protein [Thermoanaerobaculum sp.]